PGAQPPKLTLARSRFPGQRLNVIQHRAIRSTGCCPHLVAPDTLVSRLRSATTEIDTQSCRAERGTYIPHCPTRRKLSSPQRRAKREDNMKPTILTPILAVASLTVLAVPARLAAQVGGTGTTNRIPIWTDSTTLGNSIIFQTGGLRVGTSLQVIGGSGRAGFFGINGGTGGSIKLTAGAGGSAGRNDSNGGSGGSVSITGGNGASGTTCCANANGNGGSITLQPGIGGTFLFTPRTPRQRHPSAHLRPRRHQDRNPDCDAG